MKPRQPEGTPADCPRQSTQLKPLLLRAGSAPSWWGKTHFTLTFNTEPTGRFPKSYSIVVIVTAGLTWEEHI